ncbi:Cobalt/magnesium transport protein CorA [Streptomyces sp. RB5]|uniref:Cobalt/magnesium transport protein CorA n=1 Tax=Streptomyces smaragdinus TaxID=2585196 RepID=A0A7K0CK68_9ACTN|nr:magnesium and cobalt transport protein CorA [Streptomyces smaragdinus]MQY13633.1 Cobalt/magnesium transport protein CorA [Streptomyces smaragdinus]
MFVVRRTFRTVVRLPGRRRPVDLSHPVRSPLGSSVENCVVYLDGHRLPGDPTPQEAVHFVRARGAGFVWIGLHEPDAAEIAPVAKLFGLHPLAVEAALHRAPRPRLDVFGDMALAVFKPVSYADHDVLTSSCEVVESGEITVLTGPDYIITVRHGQHGTLGPVRESLERQPEQLAHGPSAVLHAVADQVVNDCLTVTDAILTDIDTVEADVFGEGNGRADAARVYHLKRELLELKRSVAPLARPLQLLAERPLPAVDPAIRPYFRDVADHQARVTDQINGFDELLNSILQANIARVTMAQNEDMRKISAWVAVLAVPTMVCGMYGMNFDHMPELRWTYGYPAVVAVTAVICFVLHRAFRRRGWL